LWRGGTHGSDLRDDLAGQKSRTVLDRRETKVNDEGIGLKDLATLHTPFFSWPHTSFGAPLGRASHPYFAGQVHAL
jgi:hypothetical protein